MLNFEEWIFLIQLFSNNLGFTEARLQGPQHGAAVCLCRSDVLGDVAR